MSDTKRATKPRKKAATGAARRTGRPAKPRAVAAAPVPRPAEAQRFSRTMWLADILRQRIISGDYKPGERIREAQLRTEFGFSNGPIREALQAMVADGLAERAPWQGVRVKSLSKPQIVELFQVRLALLEYAAELAARHPSAEVIASGAEVEKSHAEVFAQIGSSAGHPSFNGRLSQWLLASAGNGALREVWEKTMLQTLVYVNASMMKSRGTRSRALIHLLIDRICAGDVPQARDAARALTRQTLLDLGIDGTV